MTVCVCEHSKTEHDRLNNLGIIGCAAYLGVGNWCTCQKFKQDNLKYLEDLYNERF